MVADFLEFGGDLQAARDEWETDGKDWEIWQDDR